MAWRLTLTNASLAHTRTHMPNRSFLLSLGHFVLAVPETVLALPHMSHFNTASTRPQTSARHQFSARNRCIHARTHARHRRAAGRRPQATAAAGHIIPMACTCWHLDALAPGPKAPMPPRGTSRAAATSLAAHNGVVASRRARAGAGSWELGAGSGEPSRPRIVDVASWTSHRVGSNLKEPQETSTQLRTSTQEPHELNRRPARSTASSYISDASFGSARFCSAASAASMARPSATSSAGPRPRPRPR